MKEIKLRLDEIVPFDVYFAGVVAMGRWHPGANFDKESGTYSRGQMSVEECADEALDMIEVRRKVLGTVS